jgi:hypothetical protein
MPILLPSVWTDTHPGIPYVWSCSACEAIFDRGPLNGKAVPPQSIEEINRQFEADCKQVHAALRTVVGISSAL